MRVLVEQNSTKYESEDGWVMQRETGPNPMGPDHTDLDGQWVLRDETGAYVAHDKYRNDLAPRYGFQLA